MPTSETPDRVRQLLSLEWSDLNHLASLEEIRSWVDLDLAHVPERERFGSTASAIQVAEVLLGRLSDPLVGYQPASWTVGSEILLNSYADIWGRHTESLLESTTIPMSFKSVEEFTDLVKDLAGRANCSAKHPLFEFARHSATKRQLSRILDAENLCDLKFVHLLACILAGLRGGPAAEVAENIWDEFGHGQVDAFHANMRLDMMRNVGLAGGESVFEDLSRYPKEEVEHFNAYALNGMIKKYNRRLVGMMFATEYLVPQQLEAIVAGWRRVGVVDSDMQYLINHQVGDVEHADGWASSVVSPVLLADPSSYREVLLGVLQHLDILGRLYDSLLDHLKESVA